MLLQSKGAFIVGRHSNGSGKFKKSSFGHWQILKSMTKTEFAILALWVMLPPLLVGGALVWRLKRGIRPQITFALLSTALAVALLLFGPSWLGRYLGLHDAEILGTRVMWSPLGWICAAATLLVVVLLSFRLKRS